MRQTTKQTKTYQAPTIKVVEFMIERGYEGTVSTDSYGQYEEIDLTPSNQNSRQYQETSNWDIFQ